jgi:drug/metabolite transporter (DMT)-like permease
MREETKGMLFALLAVSQFATLGTCFKLAVARLDGYVVTVWMGLFATLALLVYLGATGRLAAVRDEFRRAPLFFALTGMVGLGLQQLLCLKSYQYLPAAQTVVLHYTYPLFMILLGRLIFRERTTKASLFCVLAGFAGVYLVLSRGKGLAFDANVGLLYCFGTAISFALFCLLLKHRSFDAVAGMCLFNLFGLLFLLVLIPCYGFSVDLTRRELLMLAYLGVFPTAIAFIFWNRSLQLSRTGSVGNFALLVPPLSLALISLVLREPMEPVQLAGMALVVGSVCVNARLSTRGRP